MSKTWTVAPSYCHEALWVTVDQSYSFSQPNLLRVSVPLFSSHNHLASSICLEKVNMQDQNVPCNNNNNANTCYLGKDTFLKMLLLYLARNSNCPHFSQHSLFSGGCVSHLCFFCIFLGCELLWDREQFVQLCKLLCELLSSEKQYVNTLNNKAVCSPLVFEDTQNLDAVLLSCYPAWTTATMTKAEYILCKWEKRLWPAKVIERLCSTLPPPFWKYHFRWWGCQRYALLYNKS